MKSSLGAVTNRHRRFVTTLATLQIRSFCFLISKETAKMVCIWLTAKMGCDGNRFVMTNLG